MKKKKNILTTTGQGWKKFSICDNAVENTLTRNPSLDPLPIAQKSSLKRNEPG
jgi:hypothetical protein